MEIVLVSLIEWMERRLKKHMALKLCLVFMVLLLAWGLASIEWASLGLI
ncbi:hypothetical protein GI582_24975 [Sulfitobacter sp. BDSS02]|nr:hypothetical protein [Sulfitobacter sp. BDSS02]MBR9852653.1 hypothetical protein [Paracoccaceae bacterium]